MNSSYRTAVALFLALAIPAGTSCAADEVRSLLPLSAFPRERIVVETRGARRHVFQAWRAESVEMKSQGLMFVRELRPDQAMIFAYEVPLYASMWMKNTLLPLDMLFADRHGCIVKVHERAQPGSLETIAAETPVVLVVEIAGGRAGELGIGVGDRVTRPEADWPTGGAPCPAPR